MSLRYTHLSLRNTHLSLTARPSHVQPNAQHQSVCLCVLCVCAEAGSVCCSALSSAYVMWGSHRFFPNMTYGDIVDVTCPSGHVVQGSGPCAKTFQVKCADRGGPAALTGGQNSCVPFMCDEYQRVAPGNYSAPFTLCSHSSTCDASPGS